MRRREKGSLTVEAAFVVPLSFFAVMLFMNLFLFLQVQLRVQQEINAIGTELMEAGTLFSAGGEDTDGKAFPESGAVALSELLRELGTAGFLSAQMKARLCDESWISYVRNGVSGFDFLGSSVYEQGSDIRILVTYSFVPDNRLFSVGGIPVKQQLVARGFSGSKRVKQEGGGDSEDEQENTVYITANGTVYHKDASCTYLKLSIRQVSKNQVDEERNSSGAKYYPCEYCDNRQAGEILYITTYGTRYHTTLSCSELLRSVTSVSEKEAIEKGYRPCSKCGG